MHEQGNDAENTMRIVGQYANQLEIGHSEHEFVFDFGQSYQNDEPPHVHTRIVTGPFYAKAFLNVLQEALERYEGKFGLLRDDQDQK